MMLYPMTSRLFTSVPSIVLFRLLLALAGLSLLSLPASASTLSVPGQCATIQAAINASISGDTVLIADGTYTGPGNVDLDFGGKNITVTSQHGAASTIINCQGTSSVNHRGFYLHSGETSAIIGGLTIENGYENGYDNNNVVIGRGGGLLIYGAGATVQNCIFKNNTSGVGGGGVSVANFYYSGNVTITNCLVSGNTCIFGEGGGIEAGDSGGTIVLNACTLTGNYGYDGGGIFNEGGGAGTISLLNCVFAANSSYTGGGVYNDSYNPNYTGGAISITNCTFTANTASSLSNICGGIYTFSINGPVGLKNCLLYGDNGSELANDSTSNLNATAIDCDVQGGYAGTGNINADPLFVDPASDLHLQAGSPCLGAGTASGAPQVTIDGKTRPAQPSIGAYEIDPRSGTTTRVTSSLNPSVDGQSVTFTAGVTGGNGTPTGTVIFTLTFNGAGGGTLQTPIALNGGSAAYTATFQTAGSYTVTAAYSGDKAFASSVSSPLTQTVQGVSTTTTLVSSLNPAAFGQSVAFTATVTGSSPTGTVTFTDSFGGGTVTTQVAMSGKTATYTSSSLSVASHQITASYSGDGGNAPSISAAVTQVVTAAKTTMTLTSSLNPSMPGQSVTFTANVTGTGGVPTGTVTLTIDGSVQAPLTLANGYYAAESVSFSVTGSHLITAAYSGDGNFSPSAAAPLTQSVVPHISPQYVSPSGSDSNPGTQAAPKLTIQAAINATVSGDTVIVEDGTYTGPGDVDLDLGGRNITVASQNGAATTIIDCQGSATVSHRGFYLHTGETSVVISGLTIENGFESPYGGYGSGGGILASSAGMTVQNCIFKNNTANAGGGVYALNSYPLNVGTIEVVNCVLSGNTASGYYGQGGAIYNGNSNGIPFAVTNCTITGNQSASAGGIENGSYPVPSSPAVLTNDIFYGDTGGEVGGSVVTASNCDIQGGYAGTGNINADPLFVNPASDLHLQPSSPCLGMGMSGGNAPTTTIDGQTRPDPPSIGAYELLPAAAPNLINDTDSSIVYNGYGWAYYANRGLGDVNDDLHATTVNGDSALYAFTGSSISYLAETNSDEGTVDVYIDGVFKQTVNCYSASRQVKKTLYSVSGLPQGLHTLKIVKTGGSYMLLDALLATPAPSVTSSTINDTSAAIAYNGYGWDYYPNRGTGDYSDDVHATQSNGDSFSCTFTGTSIGYIAETNFDEGHVQIYLDGTLQATVNAYSPTRRSQQTLWSQIGLSNTSHTLRIVKQDGQWMLLDALRLPSAITAPNLVNDTGSGVSYTGGGWFYNSGRGQGDFSDDVHATTNNGDFVSYSFTGTSVSYITETSSDEGSVDVYLDGIFKQTVNCYTASRQSKQSIYGISGLPQGQHTIKLVKTGGVYMLLDAFLYQ